MQRTPPETKPDYRKAAEKPFDALYDFVEHVESTVCVAESDLMPNRNVDFESCFRRISAGRANAIGVLEKFAPAFNVRLPWEE